jgi:hypothetical protein
VNVLDPSFIRGMIFKGEHVSRYPVGEVEGVKPELSSSLGEVPSRPVVSFRKLFFFVIYKEDEYARVLVPGKPLYPSILFASASREGSWPSIKTLD